MESWQLKQMQGLSVSAKLEKTRQRVKEWVEHWEDQVYISVDGFDSTMLAFMVWEKYPKTTAVHLITGNGFPETEKFWREMKDKGYPVILLTPTTNRKEVITKHGYPVISKEQAQYIYEARFTNSEILRHKRLHGDEKGSGKIADKWQFAIDAPFIISHKCCYHIKKAPFTKFEKQTGRHGILGETAEESLLRTQKYLRYGCNAFDTSRPLSRPIGFWTRDDLVEYQKANGLPYSKIYDLGWSQTGCAFCGFGLHMEDGLNRFERMHETHPKMYSYCIEGGEFNNKDLWAPNSKGLGMGFVFDYLGIRY